MKDFDFKGAKRKIGEIVSIVEDCPEPLKEKCFELLFKVAFSVEQTERQPSPTPNTNETGADEKQDSSAAEREVGYPKLPGNVLAFTRRYEVSSSQIQKLFLLDHDPLLPVYKIDTKVIAAAQLQKVMMILLEAGLLGDKMKAPYTELRESVREDGLLDSNFNKTLKKNARLFKGAITKDKITESETVELTGEGMQRLAEIVKELAGPTE